MIKYFILILILYSCDSITSPQIEPDPGDGNPQDEYIINFEGLNTGHYFDVCTLKWNQYPNDNFQYYQLKTEEEIISTIYQIQDTSLIRNLNPGIFEKIYLEIILDSTIADSIAHNESLEIYTRPIKPIANLSVVANPTNWSSSLNWTPSNEINTSFEKYSIYRSELNANNFILIDEIYTQTDSIYIDTITTWNYEYYYKIKTHIIDGFSRNSIMQSNVADNITNYEITLNATNNQYNKVNLNWTYDLNQEEFYAIEIWRTDIHTENPIDYYLLATITDYHKNSLEDSYLIGNGISWFYKLKLIDQFGNISYSSIVAGNALP